jgi:hypothetical protein
MKKIILIGILCIFGIHGYSQLLEDKTNIYISYQTGLYLGNELFNDHGTIAPSFYTNLSSNNGLNVNYISNFSKYLSSGFKVGVLISTNWQNKSYTSYNDSRSATINFQPVIQIHSEFQKNGLYNRLKLYAEISPVIGFTMVGIKSNLFDISSSDENIDTFTSNNLMYGLEAGIGGEYSFTNKTGAFINLSMQEGFVHSPLFVDSRYTLLGFSVGIRINISKVKRFNY